MEFDVASVKQNTTAPSQQTVHSNIPLGPQETLVTGKWFVHNDAVEGVDYHVESLVALWLNTNKQDIELVENNQCGANGIGYEPGPYSAHTEGFVEKFTTWYAGRLAAHLPR